LGAEALPQIPPKVWQFWQIGWPPPVVLQAEEPQHHCVFGDWQQLASTWHTPLLPVHWQTFWKHRLGDWQHLTPLGAEALLHIPPAVWQFWQIGTPDPVVLQAVVAQHHWSEGV
jgi:hypothetical protein